MFKVCPIVLGSYPSLDHSYHTALLLLLVLPKVLDKLEIEKEVLFAGP